jgi:probable phosphoglycerate mutase
MLRRLGPGPRTHAILASPLGRAARTAELAFGPGVARPEPALMEIDVGRWSGRRIADVLATAGLPPEPDMLTLYSAAPGGEGFAALAARCEGLLRRLDGPAILVGHGIAGRMIRTLALGLPLGALSDLPGAQGGAFRIRDGHEEVAWPEPRDGPVA